MRPFDHDRATAIANMRAAGYVWGEWQDWAFVRLSAIARRDCPHSGAARSLIAKLTEAAKAGRVLTPVYVGGATEL